MLLVSSCSKLSDTCKSRDIQKNLSKEMEAASDQLDFERASIFRDRIKSLNIIQSSQRINEANRRTPSTRTIVLQDSRHDTLGI